MNAGAIDQLSPLAADLRAQNPDRYLAALFAPPARRNALIALYAFDHEIARARWTLKEPMAGLIRLQWWQDVIDGFSEDRTVAHPVVQELQRAVTEVGLNKSYLERALEARRRPLEDDKPPTAEDLKRHLHDVGGSISCAAAELLGGRQPDVLAIVNRVGLVGAALEHCRFLQSLAPGSNVWLPEEWCVGEAGDAGTMADTFAKRHLADWAEKELAEARRQAGSIPRAVLPALFPGTLASLRLRDPIGSEPPLPLPTAVPRLIWCWMRRRF